jgi:hypothetical protein
MRSSGWCGSIRDFLNTDSANVTHNLEEFVGGQLNLPVEVSQTRSLDRFARAAPP